MLEVLTYIKTAKEITELSFSADAFLNDLLRAVCFFIQDGLFISYTHRQFQEYYTAMFISTAPPKKQKRLIQRACPSHMPNDVVKILHEMNQELSERQFALPAIRAMLKKAQYSGKIDDAFLRRIYKLMITHVVVSDDSLGYFLGSSEVWQLLRFIRTAYREVVSFRPSASYDSGKALRDYVSANGVDFVDDNKRCPVRLVDSDPMFFKALKAVQVFHPDSFKYAVDVKDFLELRQSRRTESIDQLLK